MEGKKEERSQEGEEEKSSPGPRLGFFPPFKCMCMSITACMCLFVHHVDAVPTEAKRGFWIL